MAAIHHQDYQVSYEPELATITCSGSFRLRGDEYAPIADILNQAADAQPPLITLDVRELQFLNSSGINTLSKFVIRVRNHQASRMLVKGSGQFPWQKKSLPNLQRLMPDLQLEIE